MVERERQDWLGHRSIWYHTSLTWLSKTLTVTSFRNISTKYFCLFLSGPYDISTDRSYCPCSAFPLPACNTGLYFTLAWGHQSLSQQHHSHAHLQYGFWPCLKDGPWTWVPPLAWDCQWNLSPAPSLGCRSLGTVPHGWGSSLAPSPSRDQPVLAAPWQF